MLWEEGLEAPVRAELEGARERGVPGAEDAIFEVDRVGGGSRVVAAIVRRLAADLDRRKRDLGRTGFSPPPPTS